MRIGELLIEQGKLSKSELERALVDKPLDTRIVSFLITRGLLEFDEASLALGHQKRVACALSKHLAHRDPALARLIPAELGRGSCALPIGRTSKGAVIVCVRDPSAAVLAALTQAISGDVLMVVTPAQRLERLVADAYGKAPTGELDIDIEVDSAGAPRVSRRPMPTPPMPLPRAATPPPLPTSLARAATAPPSPPLPDLQLLDPDSVRLALTDLDDERVAKDHTQSGQIPKGGSTLPPPMQQSVARPSPIEELVSGLEQVSDRQAATDLVLGYIATRWDCGLVLAIREKVAIGYRGHRVNAPETVTVSLGSPSTVQRAFQTRELSADAPPGVGQSALVHALNGAKMPVAAPVLIGGNPVAILAVGDPIAGGGHASDLKVVADALGTAYKRIHAR